MAGTLSLVTLLALTFCSVITVDAIYTKTSPVLQLDSKSYDTLIARSNHTSV
jgi:hypothetical protein